MRGKYSRYLILVAVLLVAGVALLAAACGGSEETTATTAAVTETTAVATETTAATEATGPATGTSGNVVVEGLVDDPQTLTIEALEGMNVADINVEHPKLGPTDYRGVLLTDLFAELGVQDAATAVTMAASDGYMVEIALADLEASPDAMLAIGDDGTITVIIPGMEAKNWVKDVVTMEFK
jgi:hypothetical protein